MERIIYRAASAVVAESLIYQRFYFDVFQRKVEVPYPETRILSLCASWGFFWELSGLPCLFTFLRRVSLCLMLEVWRRSGCQRRSVGLPAAVGHQGSGRSGGGGCHGSGRSGQQRRLPGVG